MLAGWRQARNERRAARLARAARPWDRQRLLLLFGGLVTAAVLMVAGLGFAVWYAVKGTTSAEQHGSELPAATSSASTKAASSPDVRDEIAAEPMLAVDRSAAFTPDITSRQAGSIVVPAATIDLGEADVPTGFPHTPKGAVGQLAAIEKAVLESMSLPTARAIHQAWVAPAGPSFENWELTRNVQSFLASAKQSGTEKDITTLVSVTPAAALVKGTDGPDWTVACVLVDVRAAISVESRMGYGWCQRMQWIDGRWMIAAGVVPAAAPSVWPGSALAVDAGWLTWKQK